MSVETLFETPFGMRFIHEPSANYWYLKMGPESGFAGIVILCMDRDRNVILLKNHRVPVGVESIEIPRGGLMAGETPSQGAIRELFEETACVIAEDDLIDLGTLHPDTGAISSEVALFAAKYAGSFHEAQGLTHDRVESLSLNICSFDALLDMISRNKIRDGFTIAAVARLMIQERVCDRDALS